MRTSIYSGPEPQIPRRSVAGFTLIEILVTLGILAIMSAVMIGYSAESGRQTFLLLTRESVIQLFNRAKSYAQTAYSPNGSGTSNPSGMDICGYGLHIDRTNEILTVFESEARKSAGGCDARQNFSFSSTTDSLLTGSLNSYVIDQSKLNIISDTSGNLDDVVFTSPNGQTYIYTEADNSGTATEGGIGLDLIANTSEKMEVDITNAGQISWQ